MTTYALRVINKTKKDQDFFFFTAPPDVGTTADPTVYTNTWVATTGSPNEPIDITTILDFYGWCGPALATIGGKTTVKQGLSSDLATLGVKSGKKGSTFHTAYNKAKRHFEWDGSSGATAEAGCYEIVTGNDFTSDDNLLIGMSMDDPQGGSIPIPVACISADPGMNYNIAPVIKFYVAVGSSVTGTIIDYQEVSSTSGCYDFSPTGKGAGMFYGEIHYEADGTWSTPSYEDTPPRSVESKVGDGWLQVAVAFALPILVATLKTAIKDAVKTALQGLHYQIGDLTFTSDGTSLTVNYKLPTATEEVIAKPFSEITVSLDAKSEILEIKFAPYQASPVVGAAAGAVGGPSSALKTALSDAILGVKTIPSGEKLTIT